MWCQNCKTEVTTKLGDDGQSLICNSCGATTNVSSQTSAETITQSAHDLLKKWETKQAELANPATQHINEAIDVDDALKRLEQDVQASQPALANASIPSSKIEGQPPTHKIAPSTKPTVMPAKPIKSKPAEIAGIKPPEVTQGSLSEKPPQTKPVKKTPAGTVPNVPVQNRLIPAPEEPIPKPSVPETATDNSDSQQGQVKFGHSQPLDEVEIQRAIKRHYRRKKNWSAVFGQMLCYLGALAMTCGGAGLVGIHFGSLEFPETTGWLTIIGGQLIFFVGLATSLIARSEQTLTDLHARCDELSELSQRQQQLIQKHQDHIDQVLANQSSTKPVQESRFRRTPGVQTESLPA